MEPPNSVSTFYKEVISPVTSVTMVKKHLLTGDAQARGFDLLGSLKKVKSKVPKMGVNSTRCLHEGLYKFSENSDLSRHLSGGTDPRVSPLYQGWSSSMVLPANHLSS